MSPKISRDLSKHRLEQAKENLEEAELLYNANKFKGANNRAYYSIFHSIKAVFRTVLCNMSQKIIEKRE